MILTERDWKLLAENSIFQQYSEKALSTLTQSDLRSAIATVSKVHDEKSAALVKYLRFLLDMITPPGNVVFPTAVGTSINPKDAANYDEICPSGSYMRLIAVYNNKAGANTIYLSSAAASIVYVDGYKFAAAGWAAWVNTNWHKGPLYIACTAADAGTIVMYELCT